MEHVEKSERFYCLPQSELVDIKLELIHDVQNLLAPSKNAEQAALAKLAEDEIWTINNGRELAEICPTLPHVQPRLLTVSMEAPDLRATQWAELVTRRVGDVELRLGGLECEYDAHDDLLQPLLGSKLVHLEGCVGTPAAVAALASVVHNARLTIRMPAPLDLSALSGTYEQLGVYTFPLPTTSPKCALPSSPSPALPVDGADEGSWEAVAHTVASFAPNGDRFGELDVLDSELRAEDVQLLLLRLQELRVRTGGEGDTRAETHGSKVHLYITDDCKLNSESAQHKLMI
ncbi:uncharacterized protein LOC108680717 isoform X2 [Hyalella azteca]|uniref:Uncharacterized protein LOC108680717 isoform X2 n=1 Tax=Hyalella azteca TaxID=294128 RepID=A0A979FRZ2_HYAAZ|nr:uncharacterized protein LOC108680717 isoform X2 [Hyalella azteca]